MPVEIVVPQIGEAIAELQLVTWLKEEGDPVKQGEPLFEVDSDKAVVEVEAFAEGTLAKILVPAGSAVMPQDVVGIITAPGEAYAAEEKAPPSPIKAPSPAALHASPVARRMAPDLGVDLEGVEGTGRSGRITADDVRRAARKPPPGAREPAGRVLASPRARARAHELNVALHDLEGTGIDGMVVERDVMGAADGAAQPMPRQRLAIAAKMVRSKQNVPHFYLMVDVDMGAAGALRTYCRDTLGWEAAPTYTSLLVRACALALARTPEVNVAYAEGGIRKRSGVHIGIAVALEDGLIVPVVRDAGRLGLAETSERLGALVARAREGKLQAGDLVEKSMVVSNLGMYSVDTFVAIIDVPDPMILAVGRVAERVVPVEGQIAIRPMCTLTLSVDHRVLDGVQGARFLEQVKRYLENPFELMG